MRRRFSTKRPPSGYIFFTDRDLGNTIPDALLGAGQLVQRHDDVFPSSVLDPVWLSHVGKQGWVALSHNKKIGRNDIERDAAMRAGVPLLFLVGKHTHAHLATNLVATLPKVLAFLDRHNPPFIAKVYYPDRFSALGKSPGRVELWLSEDQWKKGWRGTRRTHRHGPN